MERLETVVLYSLGVLFIMKCLQDNDKYLQIQIQAELTKIKFKLRISLNDHNLNFICFSFQYFFSFWIIESFFHHLKKVYRLHRSN